MQLFIMGGDLLSSSISNILLAFHSGLSPCQNLLLEGRQYVVDVDVDVDDLYHFDSFQWWSLVLQIDRTVYLDNHY